MVGVLLSKRRQEFLQFVCEHPILYQEIFDPTTIDVSSQVDIIYSDAPTESVGALQVICFDQEPLEEVFANYIISSLSQPVKSFSSCLYCFDYFYRFLHKDFSPVHMITILPEVKDLDPELFEAKTVELQHISKTEQLQQEDELVAEVPDELELEIIPEKPQEPISAAEPPDAPLFTEPEPISEPTPAYIPQPQPQPAYIPQQPTYVPPQPQPTYVPPQPQYPYGQPYYQTPQQQGMPYGYGPSQGTTDFFGSAIMSAPPVMSPATMQPGTVAVRGRAQAGSIRPRGLKSKTKSFQVPVITMSAITDKTGVSSIAYLLAQILAEQHLTAKVLYVDLNLSNPNSIATSLGLNLDTDAAITKIAGLSQDDFMNNLALLTEVVGMGRSSISVITFGQATFAQKRMLANANLEQLLASLSNNFDLVVVDMGKVQSTLPYQIALLNSHLARHIMLADGSDSRMIKAFISSVQELPRSYEIVVNKYTPQAGIFTINQTLHMQPIASIGLHRNVDAFLTGRLPIEGTALYNELTKLGGVL